MKKAQLMLLAGMMTAVTLATHPRKTFAQTQQQPLDSSVMRLTSKPIQQDTARTRKDKDIYLAFYCLNYSLRLAYSLDGNAYLDNTLEGDVKRAKQEVNSLLSSLPKRLELDEYLALILKNGVDNCITVAISQANAKSFQEGYGKYLLNEYPIANLVRQESYNYIGEQCEGSGLYRLAIANYTDAVLNSWPEAETRLDDSTRKNAYFKSVNCLEKYLADSTVSQNDISSVIMWVGIMANNLGRLHEAELWLTSAVNADSENRAAHYWRSKVYEARYYKEREKLPGQKTRKERKSIKEEAEKCWKLSREDKKMAEGLVPYY